MTPDQLLDALGELDDELVQSTDHRRHSNHRPVRFIPLAAVAAAIVVIVFGAVVAAQNFGFAFIPIGTASEDALVQDASGNSTESERHDGWVADEEPDLYNGHTLLPEVPPTACFTATVTVIRGESDGYLVTIHEISQEDLNIDVAFVAFNGAFTPPYPAGTLLTVSYTAVDAESDPVILYAHTVTPKP